MQFPTKRHRNTCALLQLPPPQYLQLSLELRLGKPSQPGVETKTESSVQGFLHGCLLSVRHTDQKKRLKMNAGELQSWAGLEATAKPGWKLS